MPMKHRKPQAVYHSSERSPAIYLADLVRAFAVLVPADDATRQAIAEALGFEWGEVQEAIADSLKVESGSSRLTGNQVDLTVNKPDTTIQPASASSRADWLPSQIEQAVGENEPPKVQVKPLEVGPGDQAYLLPPFEPLLVPNWTRGILTGVLATESDDGPIDINLLVDLVARRAHLDEIPRERIPTLRRGVQLLIDVSEAMMPFSRDQEWLRAAIDHLVPPDRLEIQRFAGCPTRGAGMGPRRKWDAYHYPKRPGTVILLLTDLGIGRPLFSTEPAGLEEWKAYAQGAKRAGCPLVAMTPYAQERWPAGLEDFMKIIEWDRHTNATKVRMVVGTGHEVG